MRILQLCMFTNHWGHGFDVESHDIENGKNVLDLDDDYGKNFDFVLGSPPCDQFTKANQHNWLELPSSHIEVAEKVFRICKKSGKPFVFENPPGRIVKLIPELGKYRVLTLNDTGTNKEWVLYSNQILFSPGVSRYGRKSISNYGIKNRLAYPPFFIEYLKTQLLVRPGC